jgi:hypothetical protein
VAGKAELRVIPQPIGILVLLIGFLVRANGAVRAQVVFCLFGASAAVQMPALGGATLVPAVLFLPFLAYWALREVPLTFWRHVPRGAAWYMGLVAWGVISAMLVPRLLEGQVNILTNDRSASVPTVGAFPLRPVSGNFTQTVYALGDLAALVSFCILLAKPGRHGDFRKGVTILATLNIAAALTSIAAFYSGAFDPISVFRTAGAIFDAYEVGGLVRIQGMFSETSAFSGFSLPIFAFMATLWLLDPRPGPAGPLALVTLLLLLFSTSATAYAGLSAYGGLACAGLAARRIQAAVRRKPVLAVILIAAGVLLLAAILFEFRALTRVYEFFDQLLFKKMESESGRQRGMLNTAAWSNFVDTFGLGVGLGSTSASSYPLVLLSNVGLIGTGAFIGFLASLFPKERPAQRLSAVPEAARQAVLAALCAAAISATVFELGVLFYAYAAAAMTPERRTGAGGQR